MAALVGVDEHEDDSEVEGEDIPEGTYSLTGLNLSLVKPEVDTELVQSGEVVFLCLLGVGWWFNSMSRGGAKVGKGPPPEERDRSSRPML